MPIRILQLSPKPALPRLQRRGPVQQALDDHVDVVNALGDGLEVGSSRLGWKVQLGVG